jgi:hypothetical protein
MRGLIQGLSFVALILMGLPGHAQSIPLQNINQSDMENLVSDFSANFRHTSVSGASPLGHIFGFEVGLVGGVGKTPKIQNLAHEADSSANVSQLPHAEILGMITVPAGFTIEGGLTPKIGNSDFKFNLYALAAKWTPTELFFDLPVSLAVKAQMSKSHLDFHQTINSVPTDFSYDNTVTALSAIVSKDFIMVEPYFELGVMSGKGNLDVTGSGTVFDTSFTTSQSASAKRTSTYWSLGAELKLLVVKLGAEYSHAYGDNSFTGKLSFYF